jgi:hypothetical protein
MKKDLPYYIHCFTHLKQDMKNGGAPRNLISISNDYTILINRNSVENQKSAFNLSQFAEKQIFLPYAEELYPDLGNIAVHRKKFGF